MCLIEKRSLHEVAASARKGADTTVAFIQDLAVAFPPMSLPNLKAATDVVERAMAGRQREAAVNRGRARRLRLVKGAVVRPCLP